jgi:tRNA dimethylallyltransferase
VGGTGFYLRALFDGLFEEPDLGVEGRARLRRWLGGLPPEEAARWARRLDRRFGGGGVQRSHRAIEVALLAGRPLSALQADAAPAALGLRPWYALLALERDALRERIARRTAAMLAAGWEAEVRSLLEAGLPRDAPGLSAVGYREIVASLGGAGGRAALAAGIAGATVRYAKRQETWFRHQLRGPVARFDAALGADVLARAVLAGYRAAAES